MQDRYVGDIGDFVKLAILRALSPGHRVGIAWWLYPDESHNSDGRHIAYLDRPAEWRTFDTELFDRLRGLVARADRSVGALQRENLLPDAIYCSALVPVVGSPAQRRVARSSWSQDNQEKLRDCDLVFADPDNGLETAGYSVGSRAGGKCISLAEVQALASPLRTLIIYHHQTRRKGGHVAELEYWADRLRGLGFSTVDVIRSRPFSPRAFFILNASPTIRARGAALVDRWQGCLTWHSSPAPQQPTLMESSPDLKANLGERRSLSQSCAVNQ